MSFDGHYTGVRLADLLKATTQSYSVSDKQVLAHIHDQAANAQLAGRLLEGDATWTSEVCAAHRLQNCINKSAFTAVPNLEKVLAVCRKLVAHFKHSSVKTDALLNKLKALSKKPLKPVQDVSTRWNSVFYMLSRLLYLKVALVSLFEDDPDFAEVTLLMLTSQQWDIIKNMADVLEVIEVATTQLSGEQYPTMSLVLLLVFGLRSQLADNEEASDQGVVSSFKESFRTQLTQRFSLDDLVLSSLPILCSALDPRFRSLSFLTLTEREEVKQTLIEMMEDRSQALVMSLPGKRARKTSSLHCYTDGVKKTQMRRGAMMQR